MTEPSKTLGGRLPLADPAALTGAQRELFSRDEGMTHTAPSPSIAHPDPARWPWYTFGGRLGSRYSGWVRKSPLRHPLGHDVMSRVMGDT